MTASQAKQAAEDQLNLILLLKDEIEILSCAMRNAGPYTPEGEALWTEIEKKQGELDELKARRYGR